MSNNTQDSNPFRRRKRHIGERVAEFLVKTTASVSIIMIFLILVFVLREAWGITAFLTGEKTEQSEQAASHEAKGDATSDSSAPESYGEVAESAEPESYNPDVEETAVDTTTASINSLSADPEEYNPDVTDYNEVPAEKKCFSRCQ